jgi:vanadium chloroperoxidase
MYDAYAAVDTAAGLPPYLAGMLPPVPSSASLDEAIAGAAYETLVQLFPSQKPFFDSILAGAGSRGTASHQFGVDVATLILADRAGDPGSGSVTYKPSLDPGKHRPDPDNAGQGFHAPDFGRLSKGFAIGTRHALATPPFKNADGSWHSSYIKALKEVHGKGIKPELMGTLPSSVAARDVNETLIGHYWAYDGAFQIGTPPRLYNQIIREIAIAQGNAPSDNASLFALVNVAVADAGILCWEQKYIHNFWRPVVGIREHDTSMGPSPAAIPDDRIDTDCDPDWLPLGAPNTNRLAKNFTPPFPAYPSGHATFGAAAFHMVRLFYNAGGRLSTNNLTPDNLFTGLQFVSEEVNGISTDNNGTARPAHVRTFPDGLWQMIDENGRSRVYLGVHWVFDAFAVDDDDDIDLGQNIGGVRLGLVTTERYL